MKQMNRPRGTTRANRRYFGDMQPPSAAALAQEKIAGSKAHSRVIAKLGRALFFSHGKAPLPF